MIQKLSELRAPPVVGRFYLVPAVYFPWLAEHFNPRMEWWPVAGPLHRDDDFFNFKLPHYHIDTRFLTKSQVRRAEGSAWRFTIEELAGRYPLARTDMDVPIGRPRLIRRKCRAAERGEYGFSNSSQVIALNKHYCGRKEAAPPILLADGRKLCPHRKYDLSQHTPGPDGIVVCPLHGLKVRCG